MADYANNTSESPYPTANAFLAIKFADMGLLELVALYEILKSGSNAIRNQMSQPRVSRLVEDRLDQVVEPIEAFTDAIVVEVRSRRPLDRWDTQYRAQVMLHYLLEGGDIKEIAEGAVDLLGALAPH